MSRPPDFKYKVSEKLSEVMDDIGVNERLVMKTRRIYKLMEKSTSIQQVIMDSRFKKVFHFGSQSECSTTFGLDSDSDALFVDSDFNVIQNMTERKPGVCNLLMIQNENISPGYCYLQYVISDVLLNTVQVIFKFREYFVQYSSDMTLLSNNAATFYAKDFPETTQCGPALSRPGDPRYMAADRVLCLSCKSPPLQAKSWLLKQTECKWPSEDVKKSCRNEGCFVVPVGSKVSEIPELEWRVSTCLQERYLMFSLNITQLRCYILMKMILKTYIHPHIKDVLTSFMCKNVLFYRLAYSSHEWHTGTLIACLRACLLHLKECVKQRNCPHFIIPGNNLLAGKMTDTERDRLLNIIYGILTNYEHLLFRIQIDDVGRRLGIKLNMIPHCPDILSPVEKTIGISGHILKTIANALSSNFRDVLCSICSVRFQIVAWMYLSQQLPILCGLNEPLVSSTRGSLMTCFSIEAHAAISANAFSYLESGLESDALSGRLKLASVLYCTGDVERTEKVLTVGLNQHDLTMLEPVCGCYFYEKKDIPNSKFQKASDFHNEEAVKFLVAFCTIFLRCEINCVPHELRYELWRVCAQKNRQWEWIGKEDDWMRLIVVDSLPYLFFLLYKVRGQLQRSDQQEALLGLEYATLKFKSDKLRHKETALNLLGQCFEQENRQRDALGCYISSLKHRYSNNAARLLVCIQLFKCLKDLK